jgi:sarcosine oxidase
MYDAIVLGLGGMGAAALAALSRRGQRTLGLEQFAIGHDRGSSHGHTRVIRTAYYEHPDYVPLCRAAFASWRQLEQRVQRRLLVDVPCLSVGFPDGELVSGVRRAAREHRLDIEALPPSDLVRRFPQFDFGGSYVGVLEREAGFLYVDRCVRALIDDACAMGAEIRENSPALDWQADRDGVTVRTAASELRAAGLVITAGPWARQALGALGAALTVMRQVVFWLPTEGRREFETPQFPVFMADLPEGCFYGIPATDGRGVKIARHYGAPELSGPEEASRVVDDADEAPIREFVRRHLAGADLPRQDSSVCIYTLTPDRHFVIDRHPEHGRVAIACGFSGHGFKFAPVVGEMLAGLLDDTNAPELFRVSRFNRGQRAGES